MMIFFPICSFAGSTLGFAAWSALTVTPNFGAMVEYVSPSGSCTPAPRQPAGRRLARSAAPPASAYRVAVHHDVGGRFVSTTQPAADSCQCRAAAARLVAAAVARVCSLASTGPATPPRSRPGRRRFSVCRLDAGFILLLQVGALRNQRTRTIHCSWRVSRPFIEVWFG